MANSHEDTLKSTPDETSPRVGLGKVRRAVYSNPYSHSSRRRSTLFLRRSTPRTSRKSPKRAKPVLVRPLTPSPRYAHPSYALYAVRGLFPLEQTPGVISLLAGKPNAALFPLTGVELTTPRVDGSTSSAKEEVKLKVDDELLAMGLQYSATSGIPPMVEWLTNFQEQEHGRRSLEEGWRVSITAGSQDAIYKASLFTFS
jgi:DNA-binding transcriptional MocR family regulator